MSSIAILETNFLVDAALPIKNAGIANQRSEDK
jgi:hypothetical protein